MIEEVASKGPIRTRIAPLVRKLNEACGIGLPEVKANKEKPKQEVPKEIQKKTPQEVSVKSELPAPEIEF